MSRLAASGLSILVAVLLLQGTAFARPTIDGVLDEAEWQTAQVFSEFVVTEPMTTEPSPYATEARMFSDDEGIYIGFRNYQPADVPRIQRRFARDVFIQADRNIIGIDFDGNGLSGYDFTVGIANSQADGTWRGEKEYSSDWDGTWYSQTSQDEDYWYSEIFIPWTVAPMQDPGESRKTMKVYFGRFLWNDGMRLAYPVAATSRPTFMSDWDQVELDFTRSQTLDWFPYVTGTYDMEEENSELKAGIDIVWRPNSGTQFTGTINPDFGQVEADDLVVNFSAFEAFFSEQRPFFTENNSLFSSEVPLGDRLIHTRRIGASPDVGDDALSDINAGAKLSHFGEKVDLGFFAVTEDDTGEAEGRDYLATRIQSRLGALAFGHTLTYVERPSLDREAMVNSVNWDWQEGGARVRGQAFYSDVVQDANQNNGFVDRDQQDWGGWTNLEYRPSDEHRWSGFLYYYGDEYDMNDFGFLKRNDWFRGVVEYQRDYTSHPNVPWLRSSYWKIKPAYEENNAGNVLQESVDASYFWKLESTSEITIQSHIETADPWDDRITRGNGLVKLDPQHSFQLKYLNPRGNDFAFSISYIPENRGTDKFAHELFISPEWYVADRVTISGEIAYTWFDEWLLWDFDTSQLATYEADVYDLNLKLDIYPSSRQEVRIKFQWVGVQADAISGQDIGPDGRITPSDVPVSDFSLSDTAVQIRYRYELAPLSDIFLVYERGGLFEAEENEESPGELFSNAWDNVVGQRVLAKVRYRF